MQRTQRVAEVGPTADVNLPGSRRNFAEAKMQEMERN